MGNRTGIFANQAGGTLVESMVAFVLLAGTAVAVFPMFNDAKRHSKSGDVRSLCENVVRGKLEEYRSGHLTTVADAANHTGEYSYLATTAPQLLLLSAPTLSQSSSGAIGAGGAAGGGAVGGGFMYSKVRYNRFFPYVCNGKSNAALFQQASYLAVNPVPQLGMRECVGSNQVQVLASDPVNIYDPPGAQTCNTPADQLVQREMPGFKLYVRLELATQWPIAKTGVLATDAEFGTTQLVTDPICPDFGSAAILSPPNPNPPSPNPPAPLYDFDGAGDAIKITVTGVIDMPSINGRQSFGAVQLADVNRMMCSVSGMVQPEAYPVRYYLSPDGRIYSVHGHGLNGLETGGWSMQSITMQGGGFPASGITSISVHPRDLSVYVTRPGSLMRYSHCAGVPLDCDVTSNNKGISDFGVAPWPSVQEWEIPSSIKFVSIDFRNGRVYGFSGDHTQLYEIWANAQKTPIGQCQACGMASQPYIETVGVPGTGQPGFTIPSLDATDPNFNNNVWPLRLSGFFVSPEGNEAFVSDLTSRVGIGSGQYTASIFRFTDTKLAYPIVTLPLDAVSFSE